MIRLAVRVRSDRAEVALAELLALAPSGVEEVELGDDLVEYAVYGAPGELPQLPQLRAAVGDALVEVISGEVADDWQERWREFHRPLVLAGRLTVRPPWEPRGREPLDVVIDPGQAFGTGAHATTRLCLELLLDLVPARGPLLDLGCGSGVLAITAAKLGFSPVLALDNDPAALEATAANAQRNGVSLQIDRHDLRVAPTPPAPVVVANLLAPLLVVWADRLAAEGSAGAAGGDRAPGPTCVIAGGLLAGECERVVRALCAAGLRERERRVAGEWAALRLEAD